MQRLAKNSIVSLFLVYAFLFSSGVSLAFEQGEQPRFCCEKESQEEQRDNAACPGIDCLCISCISLAPVHPFHINNAPLTESACYHGSRPVNLSGYFRSLERPPESC
ncbi:MAG: hypothetical protein A2010_09240 [Nitrospirae bacterium GWD2_57_9]|nr:MAG: hypothetical protein A2010_09240 [Nitrospirae bacterium GWD2_57_9]OGW46344.1 MAG: hypothetical protein A2078_01595 [Nitrospirae bacterium GWC2_57_9]